MLGYAPPNRERRETILARKRQEYRDFVPSYYEGAGGANASEDEVTSLRQASGRGGGCGGLSLLRVLLLGWTDCHDWTILTAHQGTT